MTAGEVEAFIGLAFDQMMAKAAGLGDRVADVPEVEGANSVYRLVVHCVGMSGWWLDHAILGNPTARDRDAEFTASGSLDELTDLVTEFRDRIPGLLDEISTLSEPRSPDQGKPSLRERPWPWTVSAIVLHVIEELFQHAGHVDITTDLLTESRT